MAGGDDGGSLDFEATKDQNFLLKLGDSARGGRLVDQRLLHVLLFVGGLVVVVVGWNERIGQVRKRLLAASAELFLPQATFKAFAAAFE